MLRTRYTDPVAASEKRERRERMYLAHATQILRYGPVEVAYSRKTGRATLRFPEAKRASCGESIFMVEALLSNADWVRIVA